MTTRKPAVLFIPLEFRTWQDASHWSYPTGLGFEEGFEAHGIDFLTIPSLFHPTFASSQGPSWLTFARHLIGNKRFDMVWFDIGHSQYDDNFLEWLSTLAPVRLGFLCESIATDPREFTTNPEGTKRRIANTERNLRFATHLLAVDEVDVERFNSSGTLPSMWLSNAKVPSRYIQREVSAPKRSEAIFYGALYGDRKEWLAHSRLSKLLVRPDSSPEMFTKLPAMYDNLHRALEQQLSGQVPFEQRMLPEYLRVLRSIRRDCYGLWLEGLTEGCAVVNLPQYGRMLPSRVIDGMAAARPVISWEIEFRPRTKALFEDGKEILFYSKSNPEQLAAHIERVQNDKQFARNISEAARKKLMALHTTESLIPQVLNFIDSGVEPRYDEPSALLRPSPPLESHRQASVANQSHNAGYGIAWAEQCQTVEKELQALLPQGTGSIIRYLFTELNIPLVTKADAARFICILLHTNAFFGRQKFSTLLSVLDKLGASDALSVPIDRTLALQALSAPDHQALPTEIVELVELLEVPGIQGGWKVLWSLSSALATIGIHTPEWITKLITVDPYRLPASAPPEDRSWWPAVGTKTDTKKEKSTVHTTTVASGENFNQALTTRGLWATGSPLRLHLGCGEQHFDGYINVDYPPSEHNVMQIRADIFADITRLVVNKESVDEIRLHHVFEHFSRVTALAMLIKWHEALKCGGKLHIETPDLEGAARNLLSHPNWRVKMGTVRHLAGDQAASWAYHVDHWFPERYRRTLAALGFDQVSIQQNSWPHEPHLCNVEVQAIKSRSLSREQLLQAADALLWESTVADAERPTYEVWREQLRKVLAGGEQPRACNTTQILENIPGLEVGPSAQVPIEEIYDFNQRGRDRWIQEKAKRIPAGSKVLDVGAGTCPYRHLFAHCEYKTHDFKQYEGEKLGGTKDYGHIDYVSDIVSIPVPDATFDAVICTEVFEHIPDPIGALREISRILKPGGTLLLTAPLGSGLHQLPFHFYGGYTPQWYRHFCEKSGLEINEITPNGGFFKHLAQECARAANAIQSQQQRLGANYAGLRALLADTLPRLFFELDTPCFNEAFTVGYFVEAHKAPAAGRTEDATLKALLSSIQANPENPEPYVHAALHLVDGRRFGEAKPYVASALRLLPGHPNLVRLQRELDALSKG
ncbi:MAG: methyltransferase domain-containing protein [Oligoflexia bacterium]|nr:methyltransferase domain-containing protein [Oligoflexia bacterium]